SLMLTCTPLVVWELSGSVNAVTVNSVLLKQAFSVSQELHWHRPSVSVSHFTRIAGRQSEQSGEHFPSSGMLADLTSPVRVMMKRLTSPIVESQATIASSASIRC